MTEEQLPDVVIHQTVMIPISQIRLNTWNANVMDPATFNALVDHIVDVGWSGALQVTPIPKADWEGDYRYTCVDGEHRFKAAQVLADRGLSKIPCVIHEDWDQDKAEAETTAFNVLSGRIDPIKFTASFTRLSEKYGEDITRKMMQLADDGLFKQIYRKTRDALPPDMQKQLDAAKSETKTVDELSVVLHDIMRKHGHSVDRSYIYFRYGGKTHLLVEMGVKLKKIMSKVTDESATEEVDVNDVLTDVLTAGLKARGVATADLDEPETVSYTAPAPDVVPDPTDDKDASA